MRKLVIKLVILITAVALIGAASAPIATAGLNDGEIFPTQPVPDEMWGS